jgi:TM2 domain-containing membrane protein YozV
MTRRCRTRLTACLVTCLAISGCVSISIEEERYYAQYMASDRRPLGVSEKSSVAASVLNFLLPGVGHLYLGEPGWAALHFVFGLWTWPIGGVVSAIAAGIDAEVVNKKLIAHGYMLWLGQGQQQEQQQNQQQTTVIQVVPGGAVQPVQPAQRSQTAFCAKCGVPNAASFRFCKNCGAASRR